MSAMKFRARAEYESYVSPLKGKASASDASVIYYWYSDHAPFYALLFYGKYDKTDLKTDDAKDVGAFAKAIKSAYRSKV
jgi:hypothetical protein